MNAIQGAVGSLACLCALAAGPIAGASAQATRLDEVRVRATREPSLTVPSVEQARERLERVPGGVDVIDAETYRKGRASTLYDSLGYSPGVFVQPRFGAEEARVSIRGSGLQRTFHLRGIKLLQDGIPLNLADGGGDFQAIDLLGLQHIEVYRGANALAHGGTTLGGAINFVTPTGLSAPPARLRLEAGSFGFAQGHASVAGAAGDWDWYGSASQFFQEGFRDHAEQNTQRVFANLGTRLGAGMENRLYVAAVKSDSELPGSLTKAQLKADPRQAAAFNVIGDQKRDFDLLRLSDRFVWQRGGARLELGGFWSNKDLDHPIFQVFDQVSNDFGLSAVYTRQGALAGRANVLTVGLVPVVGFVKEARFLNVRGGRGTQVDATRQRAVNLDLFAENQHYLTERFVLVLGAQASLADRRLSDKFPADGNRSLDKTYRALSPKLGLRYELDAVSQVFANLSRSFEPPSFGELTGGQFTSDLDEQTATTFEVGSRGRRGPLAWDVALYYAQVRDELLGLNDAAGNPLGTVNAGETVHRGLELGLDFRPVEALHLRAAYQLNDFRFDGDPAFGDNRLAGVPRHFLRAEALWERGGYYLGPNLEWSPEDYPVDHANTLFADGYALLGFRVGYRDPGERFAVFAEARNLTDRKYAASTGVIADAQGRDAAQFLPGDGRAVFAGFEWRL